jgi:hypothetical protein
MPIRAQGRGTHEFPGVLPESVQLVLEFLGLRPLGVRQPCAKRPGASTSALVPAVFDSCLPQS